MLIMIQSTSPAASSVLLILTLVLAIRFISDLILLTHHEQ